MKILWVNQNFLHPTTKGGQIRTLETLRQLHRRHEIHYVALEHPGAPEGPARAGEYCTRAYPCRHRAAGKNSPALLLELAAGLFRSLPVTIRRYYSADMAHQLAADLLRRDFDRVVCDFLSPAPHFPGMRDVILFQHNVETMIWRRRAEQAPDPLRRAYLRLQAERMFAYERRICRESGLVLAVSEDDAQLMRTMFGAARVAAVPTGVDLDYFAPPPDTPAGTDLVFVGSMDWTPNIDGTSFFVHEILPLIRRRRPECSLTIAGRSPTPKMNALAQQDPRIRLTGTVPDVRPHLWGASISIVPLRIGGGTRLKIYESMAARIPVVSTAIGAEGLPVRQDEHLLLADQPEAFAQACLTLLEDPGRRRQLAETAWTFVASSFSWERVARQFEQLLETGPRWQHIA
jgi:glycosyltransferase involved in cell wall biosynthesis